MRLYDVAGSSPHPPTPSFLTEVPPSNDLLVSEWLLVLGGDGKSPRMLEGYADSVLQLADFPKQGGFPPITAASAERIWEWLSALRQVDEQVIGRHIAVLRRASASVNRGSFWRRPQTGVARFDVMNRSGLRSHSARIFWWTIGAFIHRNLNRDAGDTAFPRAS